MTYRLVLDRGARRDISEAYSYYKERESRAATRFLSNLDQAITSIKLDPTRLAIDDEDLEVRGVSIKKFPYRILFQVQGNLIVVIAVMHGARDADYWKQRLQ